MNREGLADWYRNNRRRTRRLFDLVRSEAYHSRPIPLRNPVVFYEGHLPAFSLNTLVKKSLGRPGLDERLEGLFARGIDPDSQASADLGQPGEWPSRDEVRSFADDCDARVLSALAEAPLDEAAYAILEHEAMHQETMLYMWHQLPYDNKLAPSCVPADASGSTPADESVRVPAGRATLGAGPDELAFGWDNEFPRRVVDVPAFAIDAHDVTNERFLDFVESGGYHQPEWWTAEAFAWLRAEGVAHPPFWTRRGEAWKWRGMFEEVDLPPAWPVYVSQAEAEAYARWQDARLPSEAEFHRAAYGEPSGRERRFPWGDAEPDATRGVFDFASWDPVAVGRRPEGRSAWGVHDLVSNGWEWTGTDFAPFEGFQPMPSYPEYSADFFDGRHKVLKGASPATAAPLLRRSFRNWFRPNYPFVYATFRCVRPGE